MEAGTQVCKTRAGRIDKFGTESSQNIWRVQHLEIGKYKLTVKSEEGQKVVKEFEVYFDDEKSFAYYAGHLKSDEELERTSAMYRLIKFSKTKAISMFQEYAKSDDEKQRVLGNWVLRKLKAGEFDALQIGVNIGDLNERLVLGQTPFVGIHIKNKGVVAKVAEAAECRQFSIEVVTLPNLGPVINRDIRITPSAEHCQDKGQNNRAENSHQPTRLRQRVMRGSSQAVMHSASSRLRGLLFALPTRATFVFKGRLSSSDEVKTCRLERGELRSGGSLKKTIGWPTSEGEPASLVFAVSSMQLT